MPIMKIVEKSSQVHAYGYDAEKQELTVHFKEKGRPAALMYRYAAVPQPVAMAMDAADSKGSFIATALKNKFQFIKVPADPAGTVKGDLFCNGDEGVSP